METTRRGFLQGLLALTVIAAVPGIKPEVPAVTAAEAIDPWAIKAPPGWNYQWVRTALLGEPDLENLEARLNNGWTFVAPAAHPGAPVHTVDKTIAMSGLVLMQKPTLDVIASTKREQKALAERMQMMGIPAYFDEETGVWGAGSRAGRSLPEEETEVEELT